MAKRLTDADVDRIENDPDRDWFHVLDLIYSLREARRERDAAILTAQAFREERDAARAVLREVIDDDGHWHPCRIAWHAKPEGYELIVDRCLRARAALGEGE